MNSDDDSGIGIEFISLFQLMLIILKLTGVIDWNWWLVLLPTVIGVGLIVGTIFALGIYMIILAIRYKTK